jgi:hypothetical protein
MVSEYDLFHNFGKLIMTGTRVLGTFCREKEDQRNPARNI